MHWTGRSNSLFRFALQVAGRAASSHNKTTLEFS
jgi:hypothetical protein